MEQLFNKLYAALKNEIAHWNADNPDRLLGIEETHGIGSEPLSSGTFRINTPGQARFAAISLGSDAIRVVYSRQLRVEPGPQLFEDDPQTGSLIMDGVRMTIEEASKKLLAAIFEKVR